MSGRVPDILEYLPDGTVPYSDITDYMSFRLPPASSITLEDLGLIHEQLFTTSVVIDLDTCILELHYNNADTHLLDAGSPRAVHLTACTAGEHHALDMAKKLGRIDFDNLHPRMRIKTTGPDTRLVLSNLHRVSHSALREQLTEQCKAVVYDFATKEISLVFPAQRKRKAV
jgi:hypothetical protein